MCVCALVRCARVGQTCNGIRPSVLSCAASVKVIQRSVLILSSGFDILQLHSSVVPAGVKQLTSGFLASLLDHRDQTKYDGFCTALDCTEQDYCECCMVAYAVLLLDSLDLLQYFTGFSVFMLIYIYICTTYANTYIHNAPVSRLDLHYFKLAGSSLGSPPLKTFQKMIF